MAAVHEIGMGYYGIETEGVRISREIEDRVAAAYRAALDISNDQLDIQSTSIKSPASPQKSRRTA